MQKLADSKNVGDTKAYHPLSTLPGQDQWVEKYWATAQSHIDTLEQMGTPEAFWNAFKIRMTAAPDGEIAAVAKQEFARILTVMPDASLWLVSVDEKVQARLGAIRSLFIISVAPEILTSAKDFTGFKAAWGLSSTYGLGVSAMLDPALVVLCPWLLGMSTGRRGGLILVLFGQLEPGRRKPPVEMVDLVRPRLLAPITADTLPRPDLRPTQTELFVKWWVARLNDLLLVLLDPANFRDQARRYDPRSHMGMVLTLDRLFACVQDILIESRRDEFIRKALLFDALDLVEGMGLGGSQQLFSHSVVIRELQRLAEELPEEAARVTLGRCKNASDALWEVRKGFYLAERVKDEGIEIRSKSGQLQTMSMDRAVAGYLRLVRNSIHSFGRHVLDDRDVSLLVAHDGELPNGLADLAFLQLLRLVDNPKLMVRLP
jgi:hypothetical protein